jgi:hypothetical protein
VSTGSCVDVRRRVFYVSGLDIEIPLVKYKELEAHGVPVGIVLLSAGVALAALWKIKTKTTIEEIHSKISNGEIESIRRRIESTVESLAPPRVDEDE